MVYLNGQFMPTQVATVPIDDRGLLYGDGLFETMRADGGHVAWLDRHLRRLYNAAERMRIEIPETPALMAAAVNELVRQNGARDLAVRLTVTRGPHAGRTPFRSAPGPATRIITARSLPEFTSDFFERGIRAITVDCPSRDASPSRGLKTLAYLDFLFYRDWADQNDAFEAILVDTAGRVVEGSSSNVFVVKDGTIATPDVRVGLLPGVVRDVALEAIREMGAPVEERTVFSDELLAADEIFVTNSLVELASVSTLLAAGCEISLGLAVADHVRGWVCAKKRGRRTDEIGR